MQEREFRITRRALLGMGLGGSALATLTLVAACSTAPAPTTTAPKPAATSAPAGAATSTNTTLKMLLWQGPTILNPHLSQGTKDYIAARFCCEPLLTVGADGVLKPVLATEVPSKENGGISPDGRVVTYKLKQGIKWADGEPFTADDVAFTHQFITTKETTAVTLGTYLDLDQVEALDPQTVRLTFTQPAGAWYSPFTGNNGMIVPKHALEHYIGSAARNAPFNLKAFGTGPFMVTEFKPGDAVTYSPNPNFRDANKTFFKRIEIKGGGDAVSAARAVLETGDFDYAWNMQVEAQVLGQLLGGGKGELVTVPGGGVEQLFFNQADPNTDVDGERSSPKSKHPFLTDQRVRQAMALAIDRSTMAKQLYGDTGDATANVLTIPTNLRSTNTTFGLNVDRANQILDDAGYKRGGDGIRVTPTGVPMKVVYQTSINSLRQKEQALVKDAWQKIGIDTELKSVDAGVFFSSDAGNPDTYAHFSTDVQMFTSTPDSPSPILYMKRFYSADTSRDWAQKANSWSAQNFLKWSSDEFNALYDQVKIETDIDRAGQIWIQMNDLVVNSYISVPLIDRKITDVKTKGLSGPNPGPFDNLAWNIADWTRG